MNRPGCASRVLFVGNDIKRVLWRGLIYDTSVYVTHLKMPFVSYSDYLSDMVTYILPLLICRSKYIVLFVFTVLSVEYLLVLKYRQGRV